MHRSILTTLLVAACIAMMFAVAGCLGDDNSDPDQSLDSMEPGSLNPVNAVGKAEQAAGIQEDLDRFKQGQMDEAEDFTGIP